MSFVDWIDDIGIDQVAALLAVKRATVWHWRAGRCNPRVDQMRRIKTLTKGRIGYEQIIERVGVR